jgi:hypothetical protein
VYAVVGLSGFVWVATSILNHSTAMHSSVCCPFGTFNSTLQTVQRTHRLSLDSQDSDEGQSTSSDTSSDAYGDVQEGMSSEASCSSSSSWVHPDAGLSAAEMATSAAADLADLPGPPLTVRVPHNALNIPGSVSNSGRGGGQAYGRVSFASGAPGSSSSSQLHPHGPGAGVDEGSVANATPFGTMHVQQQQHALLSKQQQQQHTHGTQQHHQQQQVTGSGLGTAGQGSKVAATRRNGSSSSRTSRSSRGHRARAATGDLKEPHGLGAVLPGRGRRRLQRSHSGPAVSVLRDVSSAGQVIRMAGELLGSQSSWLGNVAGRCKPHAAILQGLQSCSAPFGVRWR